MSERFERLYDLPYNLYSVGSPVIVAAGALLKDTQTGSIIVQLKYQSVSPLIIKALKVSISAYDVVGKEIDGAIEYQYLDLNIPSGKAFGSNKAIVLSNKVIRSFSISSITVVLSDGTAHEVSLPLSPLPESTSLRSALYDPELIKQYQIAVNDHAKYVPQEANGIWQCTCGTWNSGDACMNCGATKNNIITAFDIPTLTSKRNLRLEHEKHQREEQARIVAENEAKQRAIEVERVKTQKKRNRLITIIGSPILVLVLLFAFWINPRIIQPSIKYSEAIDLLEADQNESAWILFDELGDYKDSNNLSQKAKYQHAHNLLDEGNYEGAYKLFCELEDYADSTSYAECFEWAISFEDEIEPEKYTYDASGKLSAVERTDQHTKKETYTYDDAGNLVQVKYYDEDGVWMTYNYTYYENGLQKTQECKTSYKYELTKYTYDGNGFLIRKETVDEYGEQISVFSYTNDENGNPIEETIAYRDGSTITIKNTYNENGLIIYEDGTYNYTDSGRSEQWRSWEYNDQGDKTRYTVCKNGETVIDTTFVYEYNEENLVTQCTLSYLDGDSNIYHYEYVLLYLP